MRFFSDPTLPGKLYSVACPRHGVSAREQRESKLDDLRDRFAGEAMAVLLDRAKVGGTYENIAKEAYLVADEMLKERAK